MDDTDSGVFERDDGQVRRLPNIWLKNQNGVSNYPIAYQINAAWKCIVSVCLVTKHTQDIHGDFASSRHRRAGRRRPRIFSRVARPGPVRGRAGPRVDASRPGRVKETRGALRTPKVLVYYKSHYKGLYHNLSSSCLKSQKPARSRMVVPCSLVLFRAWVVPCILGSFVVSFFHTDPFLLYNPTTVENHSSFCVRVYITAPRIQHLPVADLLIITS